jgi:hypothetical protein
MGEDYIDRPCPCSSPGYCPHYGKYVKPRIYELTHGDSEEGRRWREHLARGSSLSQHVVNFTNAVVAHVIAGMEKVDDGEKERRLALCVTCDQYEPYDKESAVYQAMDVTRRGRCRHVTCGCFLGVKAGWKEQHCPLREPRW